MKAGTILILRSEEDSEELAEAIRAMGFEPFAEPVLSIEYLDAELSETGEGRPLIFTSAHGVRAFARLDTHRGHPVFTVGSNTADEAREQGFTDIRNAEGTAEDLMDLLLLAHKTGLTTPVYMRAEDVSKNLKEILAKNGMNIEEFILYRANLAQNLSISLLKKLDNREIKAVMVFSARGGRIFSELVEQYDRTHRLKGTKALCISDGVVESVSVLPFEAAIAAQTPDRYGMIELLEKLSIS